MIGISFSTSNRSSFRRTRDDWRWQEKLEAARRTADLLKVPSQELRRRIGEISRLNRVAAHQHVISSATSAAPGIAYETRSVNSRLGLTLLFPPISPIV